MPQTVVLGGGPGGLGVLLAARRGEALARLMAGGFAIVERGPEIGAGSIGDHIITSDSTGDTFVDCLRPDGHPALAALANEPVAAAVARHGAGAVPLSLVGDLMRRIGGILAGLVAAQGGHVLTGQTATGLTQQADGSWAVALRDGTDGRPLMLQARNVVLSLGAEQPTAWLYHEKVAGAPLLPRYADQLVQSGTLFTAAGAAAVAARLRAVAEPRVAVVGGSTSAAAAANLLLSALPGVAFQPGGVSLLHRRPLRVFYGCADDALADGYTEFGPQDICPLTRRVYRLAGFRLDSRELIMRAQGIGGRQPDPRLLLHRIDQAPLAATRAILDRADLIVAALGYRPRTLPVHDTQGRPIALRGAEAARRPLVDDFCRVVDAKGAPIGGLFGLGLATGFIPSGRLGGESSFVGQANGLWLWQNDVGAIIVDQLLGGIGRDDLPDPHSPALMRSPTRPAACPPSAHQLQTVGS
jgi:hypothetical protein